MTETLMDGLLSEIERCSKHGYLLMRAIQLDKLGFKASDVWEEDG